MTRKEKLLAKLKRRPKDFSWNELTALLRGFGYKEFKPGKSGGSRRRFIHATAPPIILHKPHPDNDLKRYIIDYVIEILEREGMI